MAMCKGCGANETKTIHDSLTGRYCVLDWCNACLKVPTELKNKRTSNENAYPHNMRWVNGDGSYGD